MGFLQRITSVAEPVRPQAMTTAEYNQSFFAGDPVPEPWLGLRGGMVSPEVALTLSYVYCAVSTISDDFGTSTCQMFEDQGDDQRRRVQYRDPGIGALARMLRWQPNQWQTAKAFWSTLAWQYLLRRAGYAEIVYGGVSGFVDQLIPRHPDRVREKRDPAGRIYFELTEPGKSTRILTQDEMFVVRNLSTDGLNALSRIEYGSHALAAGLSLQEFTKNYYEKGASAALMATYKGDYDDDAEKDLHSSITRYMSGVENAGGLLVVPEDVDVKALGVNPRDAELIGLKNIGGRDVARMFKMPPSWLGIENSTSYASELQDEARYIKHVQMPIVVEFEQAIQRDLIIAVGRFFAKFNMDYLQRGDLLARMQSYEIGIKSRVLRPSECRVLEDKNPDPALDKLSEGDFRPGTSGSQLPGSSVPQKASAVERRLWLSKAAAAVSCIRRERATVTNLAKKYPGGGEPWEAALRDFYGAAHAGFVAQAMEMPIEAARTFCAQHGAQFETHGIVALHGEPGDAWEREESAELALLALEGEQVAA